MKSNFSFLESKFPVLSNFGSLAEDYLYTDSNSCLMKLGMIGETIVNLIFDYDRVPIPIENTAVSRISALVREGLLTKDITDILHALRKARNKAVHENYASIEDGKILLKMTCELCGWFFQIYGDWNYTANPFVLPPEGITEGKRTVVRERESKSNLLLIEAKEKAITAKKISKTERVKKSVRAAQNMNMTEAETRYLIDQQLQKVGWEADTVNLRYSKGARPQKGRNQAIAEWPTDSKIGQSGYADYALFVGEKLIGIIEAKRIHADIPSVIDYQCKDYASSIRNEDLCYTVGSWDKYKVPLVYATNGRPYLKQLETKSGIWSLDLRLQSNIPKAQRGWISPDGILELLEQNVDLANESLKNMPYNLLRDPDGLNLRDYQLEAIEAAEKAILNGQTAALLAMATGTGKTRTVLGMIYRFLKTGRFKRILFLVDRNALGEQAQDVFKEIKLEDLMTLNEIYNIKELDDTTVDPETRIHVATVQSLVKRIIYNESDTIPAITDYDLIIVDEAHRGYILDKEMGDTELIYRNQDDFIGKYRAVIEYFDAVKIALTATPALHTTRIFGKPVYSYTYRQAVIDGYLVDHDAPHSILTKLSKEGINYAKGETIVLYDPVTGEITNSDELEDELRFDVEKFNRQVITEKFNRTVLEEISKDIDPEGNGKTLIYAVDDQHADLIVKILKEIYEPYGIDNDAILKITGSVGGGNKKKVQEAIKRFKNEKYPSIAVTVDLLTTGIDVPEITTLVFMRRIKSRILFEQMLGRATRLCPSINKTHFEIYDAVGVYESLDPVNTMKPVVTNPAITFTELLEGLETVKNEKEVQNIIEMFLAKIQRKKRNMSAKALENFISITGGKDPTQFAEEILILSPTEAKKKLFNSRKLFEYLDEGGLNQQRPVVISDKDDELLEHTRGYGAGLKPQDYLEEFESYIRSNINEVAALNILCTRPRDLTRESLRTLKLELDRQGFTEQQLNTAYKEIQNVEITADIISLIRRYAIGSTLVPHEQRIKNAVAKLRQHHSFNKIQLSWIDRIEIYLLNESILNHQTFETGAFKNKGGFNTIDKIFGNHLNSIILELNDYLYDDGGQTA